MRVIVNRCALLDAAHIAERAVPSRSPKPVLMCLHLSTDGNRLCVRGTNLDSHASAYTSQVQVESHGECLVSSESFVRWIAESPDETLTIEASDTFVHVRGSDSHFKPSIEGNITDFPPEPKLHEAKSAVLPASIVQSLFSHTSFAISRESTRYATNCLRLVTNGKVASAVSTDGRMLAKVDIEVKANPIDVLIRHSLVSDFIAAEVDPAELVTIAHDPSRVVLSTPLIRLSSTLAEGTFPKYDDVIPAECSRRAVISREKWKHALQLSSLLVDRENRGIRMKFGVGGLDMRFRSQVSGESHVSVDCRYEGEPIEIGFNPKLIISALDVCASDEVTFEMNAENAVGKLTAGSMTFVAMPILE